MTCQERYAEAWQYASFFAVAPIQSGVDDSGGAANAFLTNSQANFETAGLRPSEGMVLYNLTQSTSGPITAVTTTTLTATGVTWDDGDAFRTVAINGSQIATIDFYLTMTAPKIDIVRSSIGACDCTLSASAEALLSLLNVLYCGINHFAVCGMPNQHLSVEQKQLLLEDVNAQLALIYSGETELCAGETGSTFPVTGWAEQSVTEFNRARIIANRWARSG